MATLRKIFFLFCVAISSCNVSPEAEEGVSRELADFRSSTISNLRYHLSFNIPAQRDSAVCGRVELLFNSTSKEFPPIDFKASPQSIVSVQIGGEKVAYRYEKEHILIDAVSQSKLFSQSTSLHQKSITIDFICADQSLNRREDLLYTLLVPDRARTLFPCFDQPNLKARFTLDLDLPSNWTAVSNTSLIADSSVDNHCRESNSIGSSADSSVDNHCRENNQICSSADSSVGNHCRESNSRKHLWFRESEPLSTYLFSFVVGKFEKETSSRNDMVINMYHRETDPDKLAQIPDIFDEVFDSVEWLEEYTGIKYPFEKYDFIVLPGFQYGGMEHTGATLYNDTRIFINKGADIKEFIKRYQLITHETAHMWFGDLVTMEWFDEVWTKEVFANYFAAMMTAEMFPGLDQSMSFVDYVKGAYSIDRTPGANPIKQSLDNLRNAGLVYGHIIYDKSPLVMDMLVSKIGQDAFRNGIMEYLNRYAYGNATWEQLVEIMDAQYHLEQKGTLRKESLEEWSRIWVENEGMPEIECKIIGSEINKKYRKKSFFIKDNKTINKLIICQKDPLGRGLKWQQKVCLLLVGIRKDAFVNDSICSTACDCISTLGKDAFVNDSAPCKVCSATSLTDTLIDEKEKSSSKKVDRSAESLLQQMDEKEKSSSKKVDRSAESLLQQMDEKEKSSSKKVDRSAESLLQQMDEKYIFFCDTITVDLKGDCVEVDLDRFDQNWLIYVVPNIDSKAYGYFKMDDATLNYCMKRVSKSHNISATEKASILINIHENYLEDNLNANEYGQFLLDYLDYETDPLLFSQALKYLGQVNLYDNVAGFDQRLWTLVQTKNPIVCRNNAFSALLSGMKDSTIVKELYDIFKGEKDFTHFLLTEQNYNVLAYELAVRLPEAALDIIALGRQKITNADRLAQYDFVSRAVSPNETALDSLFEELLLPENRRIEPWAISALGYLNHHLRSERSRKYILPALNILEEIQVTGDIFFPTNWLSALLSGHPEKEAQDIVLDFLDDNQDYPPMLKLKILQCIDY